MGCEIDYHARNGRVDRVTTEDDTYNNGNLCINGRYGFAYINSAERLTTPLLNQAQGRLEPGHDPGRRQAEGDHRRQRPRRRGRADARPG